MPARFLAFAVLFLAFTPHSAFAKRKSSSGPPRFQLRITGMLGAAHYESSNFFAEKNNLAWSGPFPTQLDVVQPGTKVDADLWLFARRRVGLIFSEENIWVDFQNRPDNFLGKPINYASASLSPAWRVSGSSGRHEVVLSVGPSYSMFPVVTSYIRQPFFDRTLAQELGAKAGIRWVIPLGNRWFAQAEAYGIKPLSHNGISTSLSETHGIGGALYIDYREPKGLGYGFGYSTGYHRITSPAVGYFYPGQLYPQYTRLNSYMATGSIIFSF